ncbi:hypothetical protein SARC_01215 [Sphaeroforma arctica JP610]|uniref:Uncharacterized protein n=1 Tax=Sphaeroforma arctica JP610 TaxID=667725 RepID=A0A0L0GCB6_9EUKA|nr:hypothetical protein SARC_01215 [Sphaeroforma arctica JP610]KNC86635.1 hypothetical protein SARC_01215 [Sphaeroforma arctica JP610]|eukprot:XP_014160537.1 hypothetical protein SARC_01215 [Sphaeroforma arctica JP610]
MADDFGTVGNLYEASDGESDISDDGGKSDSEENDRSGDFDEDDIVTYKDVFGANKDETHKQQQNQHAYP